MSLRESIGEEPNENDVVIAAPFEELLRVMAHVSVNKVNERMCGCSDNAELIELLYKWSRDVLEEGIICLPSVVSPSESVASSNF